MAGMALWQQNSQYWMRRVPLATITIRFAIIVLLRPRPSRSVVLWLSSSTQRQVRRRLSRRSGSEQRAARHGWQWRWLRLC